MGGLSRLTHRNSDRPQKAGDDIASVGLAYTSPNASVGTLTSSNPTYTALLANTSANVSNETTVSFSWLHMFTNEIGAEFTLGIPPKYTQDLTTPVTGTTHSAAAKMEVWTPTAIAKYFFRTPQDQWRPYLGLGLSYVSFHNVSVNTADPTVNALGGQSAGFSSSWVPVYNAGLIYNIDDRWSINGSISYLPIKTTANFVGATGATTSGDVKLNTTDYVIRLGYRF